MKYFKVFEKDKIKYSLDMVRVNIDFGHNLHEFNNFIQHISTYREDILKVKHYDCFRNYGYRHLWTVSDIQLGHSVSIGLDFLGTADSRHKGFIEFNPNKCETVDSLHDFIGKIFLLTVDRELIRYDLALDIPLDRMLCKLVRKGRKGYQYIDSGNGVTEYLGQRNASGFIKLYDKTKESNLSYPLTRLEITLSKSDDIKNMFPSVRLNNAQIGLETDSDLDSTDKVLVALLRQAENPQYYLGSLGYRKKKKIESYLADKTLSLDLRSAYSVKALALSYEHYSTSDIAMTT